MNLDFYLFDVNHGQSAAMKMPNGRWCIFDVGCCSGFSPVSWIATTEHQQYLRSSINPFAQPFSFVFHKATISHLHGDHLADYENLLAFLPTFFRSVDFDQGYLSDVAATSTAESWSRVEGFCGRCARVFGPRRDLHDYGGVTIREFGLPVAVARQIGGSANSRVNNASIVTRIDCYGNSILLCGDLEKEAWGVALNHPSYSPYWRPLVSNIDILVAPHHGHSSAYSADLMNLASPSVVLVSVVARDESVDGRYSSGLVRGIEVNGTMHRCITTRRYGHISVSVAPADFPWGKGRRSWCYKGNAL